MKREQSEQLLLFFCQCYSNRLRYCQAFLLLRKQISIAHQEEHLAEILCFGENKRASLLYFYMTTFGSFEIQPWYCYSFFFSAGWTHPALSTNPHFIWFFTSPSLSWLTSFRVFKMQRPELDSLFLLQFEQCIVGPPITSPELALT